MRGGTSKGVFLRERDVPPDRAALVPFLLDLFGSPDPRQIDGLGGADKLTSKAAIIGPPVRPDSDLTYLFGQVGIHAPEVDFKLNCGNLVAAVGMYAIQEGLVAPRDGVVDVRIHGLNSDRIILARVPVHGGEPLVDGDLAIGGVPGMGAPIQLDFHDLAGAITGRLLPLGTPTTVLAPEGGPPIEVSVVDCANLVVFVAADALGMQGTETPDEIDGNAGLRRRIDAIRQAVAVRVGLGEYWAARARPSNPMCVIVQHPRSYSAYTTGQVIAEEAIDLLCRQYSTGATSKALAATVTSCVGVACRIPGTVAARHFRPTAARGDLIAIGHPSGIIGVQATVAGTGAALRVRTAGIWRTARRLAEGRAYLKRAG
jgi:2-methylaconitate cis-trans-isomerase PrpF